MSGRVRPLRRRWVRLLALTAATYVLVLGAGELQHHDLACHLKSRTHCTACVSGVSGSGLLAANAPAPPVGRPIGWVYQYVQLPPVSPALRGFQGRAPPSR